jgi:uncharacterized protein YuzE
MKVTYDSTADAAYIYLLARIEPGGVKMTYTCDPIETNAEINLDFDASGRLIGIEVLGASRTLPPELLREAEHAT